MDIDRRAFIASLGGTTAVSLSAVHADYEYGPITADQEGPALAPSPGLVNAHRLRLDSLQFAQGNYQGKLSLGAEAPMPLGLALVGQIATQVPGGSGVAITLHGQAQGTLSGADATIDLSAEAQGTRLQEVGEGRRRL